MVIQMNIIWEISIYIRTDLILNLFVLFPTSKFLPSEWAAPPILTLHCIIKNNCLNFTLLLKTIINLLNFYKNILNYLALDSLLYLHKNVGNLWTIFLLMYLENWSLICDSIRILELNQFYLLWIWYFLCYISFSTVLQCISYSFIYIFGFIASDLNYHLRMKLKYFYIVIDVP